MSWFKRNRRPEDVDALTSILNSPEIQAELAGIARVTTSNLDELEGEDLEFREALDEASAALETAEHEYANALVGQDPEQAGNAVRRETGDHTLANRVAYRLWVDSLPTLSDTEFRDAARAIQTSLSPMRVDYVRRVVALDVECERRELPLLPL